MEEIKIIFKNENFLVLNKVAGMVVADENGREKETVEAWLRKRGLGEGLRRRGIVHRLDKGTSGLLLVAKTEEYLEYLKRQFRERRVLKVYLALVSGETSLDGEVKMPISRSNKFFGRFEVREDGKESQTSFERVGVVKMLGKKYSLVKVELKTGRTHQIRVHFRYLGWPLVGDRLYGGDMALGLERPFLHAQELGLVDKDGELKTFVSKIPRDLKELLGRMRYEDKK